MDRVVRFFCRSAWSVPAGFPEPYLYDRLYSGSEFAMGVEAAFARLVVGSESIQLLISMVAQNVCKVSSDQIPASVFACRREPAIR
jgi:hypothetical protein